MRRLNLIATPSLVVALCALLASGCGGSPGPDAEPSTGAPQSGGLEGAPGTDEGEAAGADSDDPFHPLNAGKVTLCHIPPGNPDNAHSITVGLAAVKAHVKHGDTLGACDSEPDAGTGGEPDAGTGGEPDAGTGGEPDAGSCQPVEAPCGEGAACCSDLACSTDGYCEPIIG
ncbi:hypothetical protein [Myxococcus faecalis]|uniref:hypothetical protein n=1 Tax=Myxococcus faecalis TaxID=3115646 RepID=UPI003CF39CB4